MTLITYGIMRKAIKNSIGKKANLSEEQSDKLAYFVLSFFGFTKELVDNHLNPKERDMFYFLQDEGLLTTRMEDRETLIYDLKKRRLDLKRWRTHYWVLPTEHLLDLANNGHEDTKEKTVYDDLPENVWPGYSEV